MRRAAVCLLLLFGVSLLLYGVIRAMPGDYVIQATAGNPNVTPEMIARLRQLYGLDQGILQGYWNWLSGALAGDLGESFVYRVPVAQVIGEKMWVSFALAFTALLLQIVIAVPVGVFCAVRRRSRGDHLLSGLALLGSCLPAFFFAAILQKIFAVDLQWLPLQGLVNARADYGGFRLVLDKAAHLILPVSVFVVTGVGNLIRFVRGNVLEALQADYIRAAKAKGLSERRVVCRHALRNSLLPFITLLSGIFPALFSGALIVEEIFAIPGLGMTAFRAMEMGDIPFMMGFNLFLAALTLLGTLLCDLLYAAADPRVRLEGGALS